MGGGAGGAGGQNPLDGFGELIAGMGASGQNPMGTQTMFGPAGAPPMKPNMPLAAGVGGLIPAALGKLFKRG